MDLNRTRSVLIVVGAIAFLSAFIQLQAEETPFKVDYRYLRDVGYLTWTNINPALYYTVEYHPNLEDTDDWDGVYRGLQDIQTSNAVITVPVARFFRVVGSPEPRHTRTLSPTSTVVAAGYYEATTLPEVDSNLTAENILGGTTIFGIQGMVLPATGDVTPEHVLEGRTFSNTEASGATGTMPNRGAQNIIPGTTAQGILEGYHDGAGEVEGDADLAAGNIKAGVNIFGVDGNVVESTGDAGIGQVLEGATFSKAGDAGLTGTMPDQGGRGFMPGAADVTIPAGYYSGAGVVTGDTALVTGNIRAGVTLFGVAGKPEVVDTEDGTAVATDLMEGKVAFASGQAITGSIPTRVFASTTTVVRSGFYAATNLTELVPELIPDNIRYAVSIFGITGTLVQATGDAEAADLLLGKKAWVDGVEVIGTMPDIGQQNIMPAAMAQAINHGYHDGTGSVAGDPSLASGNIRAGISIFGVAGNSNVVNTSSGDAIAGEILAGRTAWVAGTEVTGTIATVTLSDATTAVQAGYYTATNLALVDTDLAGDNVRAGISIFGVTGSPDVVDTSSGDAISTDLLAGKKAWVAGSEITGIMPNIGEQLVTPGTNEQSITPGYHDGTGRVAGDAGLLSENIRKDTTVFEVTGTYEGPVPWVAGMVLIHGGSNIGTNPLAIGEVYSTSYPSNYNLTVDTFYMAQYLTTKAQWDLVHNWATNNGYQFGNYGAGKGPNHPVHSVNWYDIVKWCNARSEMEGRTPAYYTNAVHVGANVYRTGTNDIEAAWVRWDAGYRLPTGDEWEYAARGGLVNKRFPWGDTISHAYANYHATGSEPYCESSPDGYHPDYVDITEPYTSPLAVFPPNHYGLYDMAGNMHNWCFDWHPDFVSTSRMTRGGGWNFNAWLCRTGYRLSFFPNTTPNRVGFRVVMTP